MENNLEKVKLECGQFLKYVEHLERMVKSSVLDGLTLQKIENCSAPLHAVNVSFANWKSRALSDVGSGYYHNNPSDKIAEFLSQKLEKSLEAAEVIHKENEPKLEINKKIKEGLHALACSLGFPERETRTIKSRSKWPKYETVVTPLYQQIQSIRCVDDIEQAKRLYKTNKESIESQLKKAKQEEVAKKYADEKAEKQKKKMATLAYCQVKYGLGAESDYGDVFDAILEKSKYLNLAHHLMENRSDWSDGPDKASYGLSGFEVTTEEDKEIFKEISYLIDDWGGDGRVFRDCKYNYSYLFTLVDEELYKDYSAVAGFVNEEDF